MAEKLKELGEEDDEVGEWGWRETGSKNLRRGKSTSVPEYSVMKRTYPADDVDGDPCSKRTFLSNSQGFTTEYIGDMKMRP